MKHKIADMNGISNIRIITEEEYEALKQSKASFMYITGIPETIIEEDKLAGHPYPGHETWDDDYYHDGNKGF